jgi:hypothetical protein
MSCGICGGQSLHWGRFPLSSSVYTVNSHSTKCSILIWGWYNSPIGGWRTKWTWSHPALTTLN